MLVLSDPAQLLFEYMQYMAHVLTKAGATPQHGSVLLAGTGGCSMPHHLNAVRPDLRLTLVEKDPTVVALGREFFFLDKLEAVGVVVHTVGIETFLTDTTDVFDVIVVDVFDSSFAPDSTLTDAFINSVRSRWSGKGCVLVNYVTDPAVQDVDGVLARWLDKWGESPAPEVYRCLNSSNVVFFGK